jgi:hypothetical protein
MRPHLLVLCTFATWIASAAECCTIPVFRYALDRWETDRFRLVLPPSTAKQPEIVDLLRPIRAGGKANLEIVTANAPDTHAASLYFPTSTEKPLWSSAFDAGTLATLLDSPGRKELLQHILAGDSAVWVLVDAGTPADTAQAERIQKRLNFLEQAAALPIQDPDDPDSQLGPGPPLKLKFSVMRLSIADPAEKAFVAMLAGPDASWKETQPFAAAVFARGRVLGAWPTEDLDDTTLEDACMFLIGRCSCRVKNQNPGWDILMNVDWDKQLAAATTSRSDATLPANQASPAAETGSAAPVVSEISATDNPWSIKSDPPKQTWILVSAAAGLAVIGLALFKSRMS